MSIEPGKIADLVIVDGDPSIRIQDTARVRYVVKDGQLVASRGRHIAHRNVPNVKPHPLPSRDKLPQGRRKVGSVEARVEAIA